MNQNNCHYNDNMKNAAKPALKMSSISNITQTMNNVQHNCALISKIQTPLGNQSVPSITIKCGNII